MQVKQVCIFFVWRYGEAAVGVQKRRFVVDSEAANVVLLSNVLLFSFSTALPVYLLFTTFKFSVSQVLISLSFSKAS